MKRVREAIYQPHPEHTERNGVSGLRNFDGEDLSYDSRSQYMKQQQKAWLEQQMKEKQMRQEQESYEEKCYSQQTSELNRMRGMLEDDFNQTKKNIRMNIVQSNLQKAQDQKDKSANEKDRKLNHERDEINETLRRGMKRPFP